MSASVTQERSAARVGSSRPVLVWAALGVLQVVLAVYCLVRWAAAGQMKPTPPGSDAMSAPATVAMWATQILGPILTVWIIRRFVVVPWRRDGRLSGDGMLVISCFVVAVPHDILLTYTSPSFSYNSRYLNAGSWLSQVPGVLTPNAHLVPEPLLLVLPAYGWAVFLAALLGCLIMDRAKRRWPGLGHLGLLGLTFASFAALDIVFESSLVWLHVQCYTGVIHNLALWEGTDHQLPLYEIAFWATFWTGMSALRYFRDDRGLTFAERGVTSMGISPGGATAVRLLALIGACTAAITLLYTVPWQLASAHNNSFPTALPSYLLNGICAPAPMPATDELPACPGRH
jgi:hypothetical protein